MATTVKFPIADEIKAAFTKDDKTNRFLKVQIDNEKYVLIGEYQLTKAPAQDFGPVGQGLIEPKIPCFLMFREKSWGNKAWGFLTWMPDDAPVAQRMLYGTGAVPLREELGHDNFGVDRVVATASEFTWDIYKGFEAAPVVSGSSSPAPAGSEDKPWSKRELAQQELDKAESEARKEYADKRPRTASGFHSVIIPLSEQAEQAVRDFKSGTYNWVELTIDEAGKFLTPTATMTVSGDLASNVDAKEPHFYLHTFQSNSVLIYSCPDGASMKNRMVYPTCKSGVAEQLSGNHSLTVKKLDIRAASELTQDALRTCVTSRASGLFKPDDKMMRDAPAATSGGGASAAPYRSNSGSTFDRQQFDSSKPVFNRGGFNKPKEDEQHSNIPSKAPKNTNSPSAMRVMMGAGAAKKTPKGVVLPPEGAYM